MAAWTNLDVGFVRSYHEHVIARGANAMDQRRVFLAKLVLRFRLVLRFAHGAILAQAFICQEHAQEREKIWRLKPLAPVPVF